MGAARRIGSWSPWSSWRVWPRWFRRRGFRWCIRASERRFDLKITDIDEQCSADYDKDAEVTKRFFQTVQNKLHWAMTGKTAAEIIAERADASKPSMGLTTWKQAPRGKILKSDVSVAKNYLSEGEMQELGRIISAYLDLAENRAQRGILMRMADWASFLNRFLELADYPVLANRGSVSSLEAKLKAEAEYETFRRQQDAEYVSDFDRVLEEARRLGAALDRPAPARALPAGKRPKKA